VLVFAFTPISRLLLRSVNGSFAPTRFSSLALKTPSDAAEGILVGEPVRVQLSNHTGHLRTYHWSAIQKGGLISLGEETLGNGRVTTISVPTQGAETGTLRIVLNGTGVFVTLPILKL
jgi:hypothetical protein